jgi:hypothetical protein
VTDAKSEGQCWPEQEAVEKWWNKHKHELKEAVTKYRLQVQIDMGEPDSPEERAEDAQRPEALAAKLEDGFTDDALELARCAETNFQNVERMAPMLKTAAPASVIWQLARDQLAGVVTRLEAQADEAEDARP